MKYVLMLYAYFKRVFRSKNFCSVFSQKMLTVLKTNFTKFERSKTFRYQDMTVLISPYKGFFPLEIFPGLPTINKISKNYRLIVTQ